MYYNNFFFLRDIGHRDCFTLDINTYVTCAAYVCGTRICIYSVCRSESWSEDETRVSKITIERECDIFEIMLLRYIQ